MSSTSILVCIAVLGGAAIMLHSILGLKRIFEIIEFIPRKTAASLRKNLQLQRALMIFFLLGYIAMGAAVFMDFVFFGEILLAAILFFGAVFVHIGLDFRGRMGEEIVRTMRGIVPICSHCKKIYDEHPGSPEESTWVPIDYYVSSRTYAQLSHGVCPNCLRKHYPEYQKDLPQES